MLGGVSTFIGYQTFASIPEKITSEITRVAETYKGKIEEKFKLIEDRLSKRENELQETTDKVNAQASQVNTKLNETLEAAQKGAGERVEKISYDYNARLRDIQIDADIQILRRQSGDAEVLKRLAQAFPNVDPSLSLSC